MMRDLSIKTIVVLLLSTLCFAEVVERVQIHMGTFVSIKTDIAHSRCVTLAFDRIGRVELALSSYDERADIYRLNMHGVAKISNDTYEALTKAQKYYIQSGGYFDITVGSITRKQMSFNDPNATYDQDAVSDARVDIKSLEFNTSYAKIESTITLDLGGFGKGFAADKAVEVLKECGVKSAVVALSGDIRCLGRCNIAIENPFGDGTIFEFETPYKETGVSTSGAYRRYVNERKYHHLIDPKRKTPNSIFASITVVSDITSSDLDAYATAASVMDKEMASKFLDSLELKYLMILHDGTVIKSDDFVY